MNNDASKKHNILFLIILGGGIIAAIFGYLWLFEWRFNISTNDAYIEGDIATISPKVSGYIEEVLVADNSAVKKGTELFKLDDRDYKINLNHANLQLEGQKKGLTTLEAQLKAAQASLKGARAQLPAAQANVDTVQLSLNRVLELNKEQFATNAQLEAAKLKLKQAKANIANVNAQIENAQSNIDVLNAKHAEMESQIKLLEVAQYKAQQDLDDTIIKAPFDGVVGNLIAKKGDLVAAGQALSSLVPTNQLYVIANYKETQIADIKPGIAADIKVDGLPTINILGRVVSVSPATGSVFSIMPPQNATGNFTKVVQRIPIRIALPKEILQANLLHAGMSVNVTIDTRNKLE